MATGQESTIPSTLPAFVREIAYDRATREYAMILDGQHLGFARTYHEAEVTLDALVCKILASYVAAPAQPLPPVAAIVETLDELAAYPSDTAPLFFHARAQFRAGVRIVRDLATYWIGCVPVQRDPARIGWPWRCGCGREHCWHAALAEAITLVGKAHADHPHLELAA